MYATNARFVADLGQVVVELLAPRPGERILDLGCGDGALTEKLVAAGCDVRGVDSSAAQIEAAKALGLDVEVADATALRFDEEFEAVFSNAVLHWVKPPERAIDGTWRALVPGGRFVGEFGGFGCVQSIVDALDAALAARGVAIETVHPWFFPDVDIYAGLLRARGFEVQSIALVPRPTELPGEVTGWLETFCGPFLQPFDQAERVAVAGEVRDALRPALLREDGVWVADYVRLRFEAVKPAQDPPDR
jgi:SAM-dependent methyltransferase